VTVTADRVFLEGVSDISANGGLGTTNGGPFGVLRVGDITVTAGNLEIRNGAEIRAGNLGGLGGNVTVTADRVFLSGDGVPFSTGIFANGFGELFEGELFEAEAGNIAVTAGNLEVCNGAEINASIEGLGRGG
jgi:hypothetical protein